MKTIALGILSIGFAAINLSPGQELWRGTSVGMTEDQVKAAIPEVVKPEKPSTLAEGATESLRLQSVQVAKIPFDASFYFKDGRLRQVSLLAKEPRSFGDSLEHFTVLRNHLREEHGQEQSTQSHRGVPDQEESVWIKGDRRVVLFLIGVLTKASLSIQYQAEPGRPTSDGRVDVPSVPRRDCEEEHKGYLADKAKAETGDADAQLKVGIRLLSGFGVEKNPAEAVRWIRRAADQDHVKAQSMLGGAYAHGMGVAKNPTEAVKWFRRAADRGDPLAQNALGFMCATGQGVQKDLAEAVKWYRKAANQGYDQAQYNLGYSYENGEGGETNSTEAVGWYRKAANQNYAPAQFKLGDSYFTGHGVQQDYVEAYAWYCLAAKRDSGAAAAQDRLAKTMSPEKIVTGNKRSEELRAEIAAKLRSGGE